MAKWRQKLGPRLKAVYIPGVISGLHDAHCYGEVGGGEFTLQVPEPWCLALVFCPLPIPLWRNQGLSLMAAPEGTWEGRVGHQSKAPYFLSPQAFQSPFLLFPFLSSICALWLVRSISRQLP